MTPDQIAEGEPPSLTFTMPTAAALLQFFGGECGEVTVRELPAGAIVDEDEEGPSPVGLWAHMTEYPEEGCVYLGANDPDATVPSDTERANTLQAAVDEYEAALRDMRDNVTSERYARCSAAIGRLRALATKK